MQMQINLVMSAAFNMDKFYYAGLAKEYVVGSHWTVSGYFDFVQSKNPDVSSTDRHMVEAALRERLRAIAGNGKAPEKAKASSVLADFEVTANDTSCHRI
jgi:hypothetical protein